MNEESSLHSKPYSGEKAKKRRWFWALPILVLLIVVSALWITDRLRESPQNLYTAAVTDAVTAAVDEIEPLVELTTDSPMTTWDEQGRVLLLSWHRHPERYAAGEEIALTNGSVWTFTDKEIAAWYEENKSGITDWADNGMEYGLTEFLIKENAPVEVAFTKTTEEFISWLEQGAKGE